MSIKVDAARRQGGPVDRLRASGGAETSACAPAAATDRGGSSGAVEHEAPATQQPLGAPVAEPVATAAAAEDAADGSDPTLTAALTSLRNRVATLDASRGKTKQF